MDTESRRELSSFVREVPQIVPESWCLQCKICCRFPAAEGVQAPTWSALEAEWASGNDQRESWFRPAADHSPTLLPELRHNEQGCQCPAFENLTNSCSIYSVRPLDCRLYPFVLAKDASGMRVVLAMDTKCPYIQAHGTGPEVVEFTSRLARYLESPTALKYLRINPQIVGHFWPEFISVAALPAMAPDGQERVSPPHPALVPLSWAQRGLLQEFLALHTHASSGYTLAGILGWSDLLRYWWMVLEGTFCLFAQQAESLFMPLPPLGEKVTTDLLRTCWEILETANRGEGVSRIEGVEPRHQRRVMASGFRPVLSNTEYLYVRKDLVSLQGNRYRSQRWAVNRCLRMWDVRVRPFQDEDLVSCLELYTVWGIRRQQRDQEAFPKALVRDGLFFHRRLMMNHRELGLTGWVAEVDGHIRGYTFGASVSSKIFCVFLEIADPAFPGLAQVLFRDFCRRLEPFEWINAMGDEGLPGLQRAKRAYRPVGVVETSIAVMGTDVTEATR